MWQRSFLVFSLVFGFTATAAKPPAVYNHMSAAEKRAWHVAEAKGSPYHFGVPGAVRTLCGQILAIVTGFPSLRYLRRTTESGSGYADDWRRRLFGRGIHRVGATGPGDVTIMETMLGLPPGTYPATLRFSGAAAYLPRVPGGEFRPGLALSLHRDNAAKDTNFFTMPPSGLTGFKTQENPFLHNFAGHLELPSAATQWFAAKTFGQIVENVFVQRVSADFGSIILIPMGNWWDQYERTQGRAYAFAERITLMDAPEHPVEAFHMFAYDGTTIGRRVGTVRFSGGFVNSKHGDQLWFLRHEGFGRK